MDRTELPSHVETVGFMPQMLRLPAVLKCVFQAIADGVSG
jgi:hypothetical protein